MQQAISLDSVVELASISRRTVWRRLNEGVIARCGADERGRALLALADVLPFLRIQLLEAGDAELLMAADRGDREAQNDLGILCLEQQQMDIALYWFKLAAEQEHADAMHWLSKLYLGGIELGGGGAILCRQIATRRLCGCPGPLWRATPSHVNSWLPGPGSK